MSDTPQPDVWARAQTWLTRANLLKAILLLAVGFGGSLITAGGNIATAANAWLALPGKIRLVEQRQTDGETRDALAAQDRAAAQRALDDILTRVGDLETEIITLSGEVFEVRIMVERVDERTTSRGPK